MPEYINRSRIFFDEFAQEFMLVLILGLTFVQNGALLFGAFLCFAFLFVRLQQPSKPTVFTLIFIYHFLQVIGYIGLSIFTGEDLNAQSPNMTRAIIASLAGLFFLFGPIIFYQNKIPVLSVATLRRHAEKLSIQKIFQAYVILYFAVNSLSVIALSLGGFAQVTFSFMNVKWGLFTLFGLLATLTGKMKREFYLSIAVEFATGFFSYFSNFKVVLFFVAFIYLIYVKRVEFKHVLTIVLASIVAFYIGVTWTNVKKEYRNFLNGGTNTQVVAVSKEEALSKIMELSNQQDGSGFDAAVKDFFLRIQYTYHFAKTMDRVPSVIPFQQGANWGQTISFVLTPRALNPDKPTYDATSKTTYYTGLRYMGSRNGTSFSLGYFGDCYIDFGLWGMWFPLLVLGFIYGATYFFFLKNASKNFLFNYAVVAALFMEFTAFEMDSTYLLGRLFSDLLVFLVLKITVFDWFIKHVSLSERQINTSPDAVTSHQSNSSDFEGKRS